MRPFLRDEVAAAGEHDRAKVGGCWPQAVAELAADTHLASDGEHRHRQLRCRERPVVLDVPQQRPVLGEPRGERFAAGIDPGVVFNPVRGHRVRLPERPPEPPREESALPSLDHAFRQVRHHKEAEVERAAMGRVHERLQPERRQQQVHEDQPLHLLWVGAGVGVGDHAADVVANQVYAVEPKGVDELAHVLRLVGLLVSRHGLLGAAGAAQVRHDHRSPACGERRDDVPPRPPRLRPAVQQHDGVAGPAADVAKPCAVHVGLLRLEGGRDDRQGRNGRHPPGAAARCRPSQARVRRQPSSAAPAT